MYSKEYTLAWLTQSFLHNRKLTLKLVRKSKKINVLLHAYMYFVLKITINNNKCVYYSIIKTYIVL